MDNIELGRRLRLLRGKMSQEDFAEKVKSIRASVGQYEIGERTPKLSYIVKVCTTFGVSADWLLGTGANSGIERETERFIDAVASINPKVIAEHIGSDDLKKWCKQVQSDLMLVCEGGKDHV